MSCLDEFDHLVRIRGAYLQEEAAVGRFLRVCSARVKEIQLFFGGSVLFMIIENGLFFCERRVWLSQPFGMTEVHFEKDIRRESVENFSQMESKSLFCSAPCCCCIPSQRSCCQPNHCSNHFQHPKVGQDEMFGLHECA